jgi:hypothetical protein
MNRRAALVAAFVLGAVLSCDSGPKAGDLAIQLTTTRSDLGAVMFTARAAEPETIDTVTAACQGCRVFMVRANEREVRGIVTGTLSQGTIANLTVSNRGVPEAYAVQALQASNRTHGVVATTGTQLVVGR